MVADLLLSQSFCFDRWKNAVRRQTPLAVGYEAVGRHLDLLYRNIDGL